MTPQQARAVRDLLSAWYTDFMPPKVKKAELMVAHHGCCGGSDVDFHMIATEEGWDTELHPAVGTGRWNQTEHIMEVAPDSVRRVHEPTTPLLRNMDIVRASQAVLATPRWMPGGEPTSPRGEGTWHAMRKAEEAGVPLVVVYPDGSVVGDVPWSPKK